MQSVLNEVCQAACIKSVPNKECQASECYMSNFSKNNISTYVRLCAVMPLPAVNRNFAVWLLSYSTNQEKFEARVDITY